MRRQELKSQSLVCLTSPRRVRVGQTATASRKTRTQSLMGKGSEVLQYPLPRWRLVGSRGRELEGGGRAASGSRGGGGGRGADRQCESHRDDAPRSVVVVLSVALALVAVVLALALASCNCPPSPDAHYQHRAQRQGH
eukprot:3209723-Rhodomonas_salina.2